MRTRFSRVAVPVLWPEEDEARQRAQPDDEQNDPHPQSCE